MDQGVSVVAEGRRRGRRTTSGRRLVLWRELVLGLAVFGVYTLVTAAGGPSRRATADANAHNLYDFEKLLHIDVEQPMNHWLINHDVLRVIANYEYAFTYILSALIMLSWLYVRHPDVYRWARSSFVILNLLAIACFALYPVTPPRLLPGLGFVDSVTQGHTFGSWGSGAVDDANSLAAMPSLHLAWALWVSVVLGYIAGSLLTQSISFVHVVVTLAVIMATANHYLLDAVGGAVFVMVSVTAAGLFSKRPGAPARRERVAAADVFFLYVETPASPQHVGGLIMLDDPEHHGTRPTRDELETLVRSRIAQLPRFMQRLSKISRWRRPHWVDVADLDWSWHVTSHDLTTASGEPGGQAALNRYVAQLQATPLPHDRPLWRVVGVSGVTATTSAVVIVAHHVIADGIGTVKHAVKLLLAPEVLSMEGGAVPAISPLKRLVATATGFAQLATDGRPRWQAGIGDSPGRAFGTVSIPLDDARDVARRLGVRMTDLVLAMAAGGLSRVVDRRTDPERELRVSVTLMVPRPGSAVEGNATAAAMIDVPLGDQPETARLAVIAKRSSRLRSGTRALASRFVMDTVAEVLPPLAHSWFARTVYGRRFFHAVASNMPGPREALDLAGYPVLPIYPILPLAPGSPVAVGALSVTGRLSFGISVHPAIVSDVVALESAVMAVYADLRAAAHAGERCDLATTPH